jgi:hypothetical protein
MNEPIAVRATTHPIGVLPFVWVDAECIYFLALEDLGRCPIESDRVTFSRLVAALIDAPESGTARLRPAIISP